MPKKLKKRPVKRKHTALTINKLVRMINELAGESNALKREFTPPPGKIWSYRQKKFVTMSAWWNDG